MYIWERLRRPGVAPGRSATAAPPPRHCRRTLKVAASRDRRPASQWRPREADGGPAAVSAVAGAGYDAGRGGGRCLGCAPRAGAGRLPRLGQCGGEARLEAPGASEGPGWPDAGAGAGRVLAGLGGPASTSMPRSTSTSNIPTAASCCVNEAEPAVDINLGGGLQSLAANLFASSIFPYAGFLYHLTRSKKAPGLTLFGFYFLLVFVAATIPAGVYGEQVHPAGRRQRMPAQLSLWSPADALESSGELCHAPESRCAASMQQR